MITVYLPTGSDGRLAREHFQSALLLELKAWLNWPICILGDFNMSLSDSIFLGQLQPGGWRRPLMIDVQGRQDPPTYRSGQQCSVIDDILISPNAFGVGEVGLVTYVEGLQHAILTVPAQAYRETPHPVMHPPPLDSTVHRQVVTPVDWAAVNDMIRRSTEQMLALCTTSAWYPLQVQLSHAWSLFLQHFKTHLEKCHVQCDSAVSPTHAYGRSWKAPPPRIKKRGHGLHDRAHTIARKCVHRLIAVARNDASPELLQKISAHRTIVMDMLCLSAAQFAAALDGPATAAPLWSERLKVLEDKLQRKQLATWKRKLACPGGRPTRAVWTCGRLPLSGCCRRRLVPHCGTCIGLAKLLVCGRLSCWTCACSWSLKVPARYLRLRPSGRSP